MANLKLLDNGLWIAALGTPQAIAVSKDMKTWYHLYLEDYSKDFNYYMMISEGKDIVACSTGRHLIVFEKKELGEAMLRGKPMMIEYGGYIDRLKGFAF